MYSINRFALVNFSAQQMYQLINDVDAYHEFLPWCGGSEVIEQSDESMTAAVTISFKGVNKTFTTLNTLTPYTEVAMQLKDGLFSELSGAWEFNSLNGDACKISLTLEFGFANRLVGAVIGPVFSKIANSMVESFCERAEEVYK